MANGSRSPRGRGVASNPANRFTHLAIVPDEPVGRMATLYLRDDARTVLAPNASPDVPFDVSLNPYRGCEHGCSYCFARTYHEYLGFSAGLDFETRILVKEDAPELLERELDDPTWRPRPVDLSGVTDPYQPVERRLQLTRRCLAVLVRSRNPVLVVTKNALVARDVDLLAELAGDDAAAVWLSVTTLDPDLAARLEPRTSLPARRLEAIARLSAAGVPCGVMVAPVIPGLTDHELPRILSEAAAAGAGFACSLPLRLPGAVAGLFADWLTEHEPHRRERVLAGVRAMRGGQLDDPRYGTRFTGQGVMARHLASLGAVTRRRLGLADAPPALSAAGFRRAAGVQCRLF